MKIFARFMSSILSPLLVPTYGVLAAFYASALYLLIPVRTRIIVTAVTFIITGVIPMLAIGALYMTKRISDPGLNKQGERTIPYVITGLCYLGCAFYLHYIHAPLWLWTFPVGGAAAVLVSIIVNHWWKISAHLAGMGGVTAIFFRIAADGIAMPGIIWWATASVLLTGLLATSRIILGRHTLGQTLAGALNGFLWVYLLSAFPF